MPVRESINSKDRRFRLLFEEHPQPMWIYDPPSGRILDANAAAAALYGYSADEFRSLTLADILGEEEALRFEAEQLHPTGPGPSVWRHRVQGGRTIDVEVAVYPIDYQDGRAALAVLMDVTGRRRLEDQLRQAQRMEAVGMLAGGVAHDFNNLLTIISGYSQLILNSLPAGDANRHSVEQIMKAGERAAALTRQLLAFSRRQVLQPKVLELNRLVTSLGVMLQRLIGEDIDLRLVLRPDVGRVNADPGQLEQVLMNLVVNSRDAMPKGGILTIETANVDLDGNYAGRHVGVNPGPYVLLAVSDTGTGMDEATRAHLFEPFFTTKGLGHGTGLGLSTVFGIVKQSGGSVEVYSEPNRGTSVKIYLPRVDQPEYADKEESKRALRRGSETILVVEDDEMVRSLVRETLAREGYRTLDSADPVEAQRVVESYRGPIHLLITDVIMPKLSGHDLAGRITALRPDMRVLYMSGYTDNAVVASGILQKEVAFLQKPFTPATLAQKVRDVLEGGHGRKRQAN